MANKEKSEQPTRRMNPLRDMMSQRGIRAGVGVLFALGLLAQTGASDALDRAVTDKHNRLRAALRPVPAPPELLVIGVDDKQATEPTRRDFARIVRNTRQARGVALDYIFVTPSTRPEDDADFAQAVKENGHVVLALFAWQSVRPFNSETQTANDALAARLPAGNPNAFASLSPVSVQALQPPLPALRDNAAALGVVDVNADADGVYRQPILLRAATGGKIVPHLSVALAAVATNTPLEQVVKNAPDTLTFGTHAVALSESGSVLLQPLLRRGGGVSAKTQNGRQSDAEPVGQRVATVSFADALALPPSTFAGKIVLVGETRTGSSDIRPTPLDNGLRGVELNAEIIANLLHVAPLRPLPDGFRWILLLLAASVPVLLYEKLAPRRATLFALLLLAGLALVMEAGFWGANWVPAWSLVLTGWTSATLFSGLQKATDEARARQKMRDEFAAYVDPVMVDKLARDPEAAYEKARRLYMAVLFTDIRNFTPYTEQTPPDIVARQMEEYLAAMTDAVFAKEGLLDKFIGDAVMALFSPFYPDGNQSARAIACALDMLERLEVLNAGWEKEGLPLFKIGVGIHAGEALFGNISSQRRKTLTALGDAVNLAARLESATKEHKATILVSDVVKNEAEPLLGRFVIFEDRGAITVKGREHAPPVPVFSVVPREAPLPAPNSSPLSADLSVKEVYSHA